MKFDILKKVLRKVPVCVIHNKESILCLDYEFDIATPEAFLRKVDQRLSNLATKPTVISQPTKKIRSKFFSVQIEEPFFSLDFNKHFLKKYDVARQLFMLQSDIKPMIVNQSAKHDFVVLIVVDGLSYVDCIDWDNVKPCLVDTVSTTKNGYRNIICKDKSIAYELFHKNYTNFFGFSYWEKEQKNELTDTLFEGFHTVKKYESFKEVLTTLPLLLKKRSYIQIVSQGLDGIAHKYRDEPPITFIVEDIYSKIQNVEKICRQSGLRGRIYVTSDHGILWKHKANLIKISPHTSSQQHHTRYYDTKILSNNSLNQTAFGKNYTALEYPYIIRNLRSNEWGVHGGVSHEESIVPYLEIHIN